MIECGVTYAQLATDVRHISAEAGDQLRTSKSAVANWVAGQEPEPQTASYIAEALSRRLGRQLTLTDCGFAQQQTRVPSSVLGLELGPDPLDTLRRIGDADIHRRKFLTASAYSVAAAASSLGFSAALDSTVPDRTVGDGGRRAGRAELDAVRDMVHFFTAIDERHGGQHGRSAVVQYLRTDVADLCRSRFTSEAHQREALMLAGCVAYLCGWKAYDNSEHGLAQRYYLQSLAITREADDPLHEAWILRIMAHNGMDISRPQHTLNLAEAALNRVRGRVAPVTEALFAVTRARALATARRGPEAVAQIRQAHDLVAAGDDEDLPYWAAIWGTPRGTVGSHTAKTFRALGDHANAERHYAASVRARPQNEHQRITALTLAAQGREQAAQGHLEAACGTWDRALDLFGGVRSARAATEIKNIRRQLTVFDRRGIRAAAQLDERARAWQLSYT
jgi:tetratricopeptide (TPR) repeat protein